MQQPGNDFHAEYGWNYGEKDVLPCFLPDYGLHNCRDYASGLLPANLKRGVLSEDGLWNVLDDCKELDIRLSQLVTKVLSGRG